VIRQDSDVKQYRAYMGILLSPTGANYRQLALNLNEAIRRFVDSPTDESRRSDMIERSALLVMTVRRDGIAAFMRVPECIRNLASRTTGAQYELNLARRLMVAVDEIKSAKRQPRPTAHASSPPPALL
jgi:hypothetical protein